MLRVYLSTRWVEDRLGHAHDLETDSVPEVEAENFSQKAAVVSRYNSEKEYGFAEAGLPRSIFIHRSVLKQAEIEVIRQGRCAVLAGPTFR